MTEPAEPARSGVRGSVAVAAGIFASRIFGLVRQRAFAHYMGAGEVADAFNQAMRIPNLLQNLFGEGALSASFIPVYARLNVAGDDEGRQRVAGAVLGILALGVATMSLLGVLAASVLVDVIAPGFEGSKRDLTVQVVRVLFPGAGLLVVSAWCLGVLNSHGRFLLSYASPVIWNLAMIATLLVWGERETLPRLAVLLAWGSVAGSLLQVLVQWPVVHRVLGAWYLSLGRGLADVRTVLRNFTPAFIGRGVTQISAFVDAWVASYLIDGSATMLANAQVVYMLPVSLFGMSIAAAQLPAMSGEAGGSEAHQRLRGRLTSGLTRVAFFVVPSAIAFVAIGDVVGGVIFRTGRFGGAETRWLWGTLAASSMGLVAATMARLYATALFALQDTRTPQRCAIVRVMVGGALGVTGAFWVGRVLGLDLRWNVVLLALGSGLAAWVEFALLRRAVFTRIGHAGVRQGTWWRIGLAGGLAAVAALGLRLALGSESMPRMLAVLVAFGLTYFTLTLVLGVPEAKGVLAMVRRRR
ncbi:MAG: murein biosynthesis integral membrane protein MurJ [Gemmatimonadaceae bacterium]|nr:murein biosynthesis integral membrane protein MurJ [Gemmatimonadaceae bacterium]